MKISTTPSSIVLQAFYLGVEAGRYDQINNPQPFSIMSRDNGYALKVVAEQTREMAGSDLDTEGATKLLVLARDAIEHVKKTEQDKED